MSNFLGTLTLIDTLQDMLSLQNIDISATDRAIISGLSLAISPGDRIVILGKNGSGKSSLLLALAGHPRYRISHGIASFAGENLLALSIEQRAQLGIFLALQNVPEIAGITLGEYLRTIHGAYLARHKPDTKPLSPFLFKRFIAPTMRLLSLSESFLERDLNYGFSGGEKRRSELLQMFLLQPHLMLLDEIDSWLDIAALDQVATFLMTQSTPERSMLIVTHNLAFIDRMAPTRIIVMATGQIVADGGSEILDLVRSGAYPEALENSSSPL